MAQDGFVRCGRSDAGFAEKRLDAAGRPQRPAQRASRAPAQRVAIDAADVSGCDMVTAVLNDTDLRQRAWNVVAAVVDPEIPVLTIADLGGLRDVAVTDGRVQVASTPTYSVCPAMNKITREIELARARSGWAKQSIERQSKSGLLRGYAPRDDDEIESPNPPRSHAPRFPRLAVNDLRRESADAVSLTFAIPQELADDYRFAPGQYLTLRTTMDGEEVRRSYSICSGPDDGEVRIAGKKVDGGAFSSWAAEELKPGDELDVMT